MTCVFTCKYTYYVDILRVMHTCTCMCVHEGLQCTCMYLPLALCIFSPSCSAMLYSTSLESRSVTSNLSCRRHGRLATSPSIAVSILPVCGHHNTSSKHRSIYTLYLYVCICTCIYLHIDLYLYHTVCIL